MPTNKLKTRLKKNIVYAGSGALARTEKEREEIIYKIVILESSYVQKCEFRRLLCWLGFCMGKNNQNVIIITRLLDGFFLSVGR